MKNVALTARYNGMREFNMFPYLISNKELAWGPEVGREYGFEDSAFYEILAQGICPEPRPVLIGEYFWFSKWNAAKFFHWMRTEAPEEDLQAIAGIIRRNNRFGDYDHIDDSDPLQFILDALEDRRGGRNYSRRFKIKLT